jgi:hypothetical protein
VLAQRVLALTVVVVGPAAMARRESVEEKAKAIPGSSSRGVSAEEIPSSCCPSLPKSVSHTKQLADLITILPLVANFLFEEEWGRVLLTSTWLLDRHRLAESKMLWHALVNHLADMEIDTAQRWAPAENRRKWTNIIFGFTHTGLSDSD